MFTFTLEKEAMLIKLHVTKLSYINIFPFFFIKYSFVTIQKLKCPFNLLNRVFKGITIPVQ